MTTAPGRPEPEPEPESDGMPPGVAPGNEPAGVAETLPSRWPETLPPDIVLALRTIIVPAAPENAVTLDFTDAQKSRLIDQAGRKSDQAHNFKKWLLAVGFAVFCLLLLTTVGLVVFLTLQNEVAFASEIMAGAFGLVSGLLTGVGGTLGIIALRRWW